jgi:hypothetical protein
LVSDEVQKGHLAADQAQGRLQAIRLPSSAQKFLLGLDPIVPAELTEIAREEKLNLPEIGDLSPRMRDALKRAGWDEPELMRDYL